MRTSDSYYEPPAYYETTGVQCESCEAWDAEETSYGALCPYCHDEVLRDIAEDRAFEAYRESQW